MAVVRKYHADVTDFVAPFQTLKVRKSHACHTDLRFTRI